jgi:hypothetical protein
MSLPDRYAPLDDAHVRIADEQEQQRDRHNPYLALDAAHERIAREQEAERTRQAEQSQKESSAPDHGNAPAASVSAPQNEYHNTVDRDQQRQEGIVQALLAGDEPRIAEIRQEMFDRGHKGYEINSEINKADAIAQNRLAQSSNPEISSRETRQKQFLSERQGQEHDLDKGEDMSLD